MSSLKCSNCGAGIHYHGLPEGIEYIFFPLSVWEKLTIIGCPSDRIEIDTEYDNKYSYAWRCPNCGTFAFFNMRGGVTHVYKITSGNPPILESDCKMEFGLFFDDYLWDEITEASTSIQDILVKYSGYHWLAKNETEMFVFEDREMSRCLANYERIEVAKE